jgi:DNA-binding MarR family transcriptional regulator/GNAT superfamily N-acetyltransferase
LVETVKYLQGLAMTSNPEVASRIATVRAFNRFYTRQIGLLQDGIHHSPFSLAEARVLYELARGATTATAIAKALDLDPGYLSRIIAKFTQEDLVTKATSTDDRRQYQLQLTNEGWQTFARLDRGSDELVGAMLADLSAVAQERLIAAMRSIEGLLTVRTEKPSYVLRPHRAGDMGWVVGRHAVIYGGEYQWDFSFEGLVAEIVAAFVRDFDPSREFCWIAEIDGEPVGSVFLVKETDDQARLRLLLVEPKARGLGVGRRLVDECVRFARQKGYRSITLWTHSILTAARHLYEDAGFRLVGTEHYRKFGHELVGETWELGLSS